MFLSGSALAGTAVEARRTAARPASEEMKRFMR
jgi:hypothetical protein